MSDATDPKPFPLSAETIYALYTAKGGVFEETETPTPRPSFFPAGAPDPVAMWQVVFGRPSEPVADAYRKAAHSAESTGKAGAMRELALATVCAVARRGADAVVEGVDGKTQLDAKMAFVALLKVYPMIPEGIGKRLGALAGAAIRSGEKE